MRKYIIVAFLLIFALICILIAGLGFKVGPFVIYSYGNIENVNRERKVLLQELNDKNINEYEKTKKLLSTAASKYKEKKAKYDELVESGDISPESNIYNSSLYDMDFLYTTIGNFATQNGVILQLDIFKSSTSTSLSSEYVVCNLNFTVTGDYIPITNFIYNIEDDDTLKFEISNFVMEKGGENLQATFSVKNVPINSKNLSIIPTTSTEITPTQSEN